MTGPAKESKEDRSRFRWLIFLSISLACLYGLIARLSWEFDLERPGTKRPIVEVMVLFAAAFLAYLFAVKVATKAREERRLLALICGTAVLFRLVMLFSLPIQEIDIYRYLWDGAVSNAGVSPFRYSPEQVRTTTISQTIDPELRRLVRLRNQQPALAEILGRVHYGQLPTIYPPVSQAVFAAATWTTPSFASVYFRLFIMKAWFVVFDLATLWLVVKLLQLCRKPVGLCVIYAWCPLLLKEVANSGHLDAVAVFLTTLAVYLALRLFATEESKRISATNTVCASGVAMVLALAVGAKIYPIVLAPWLMVSFIKRLGPWRMLIPLAVFALTTLLVVWPMLPNPAMHPPPNTAAGGSNPSPSPVDENFDSATVSLGNDPSLGLTTFLRQWEMNDFIFLLLVENLKPNAKTPAGHAPWFSVAPQPIRTRIVEAVSSMFDLKPGQAPFFVARGITAMLFAVLALWFAVRAGRSTELAPWLCAAFLTLAWFWLLCPTQNPWYWTWALPLLPFARSRVWLLMSGLVLLYYFRFWLSYHWPNTPVLGTSYIGAAFFDFVVTWIEFAPWFAWLLLDYYQSLRGSLKVGAKVHNIRQL